MSSSRFQPITATLALVTLLLISVSAMADTELVRFTEGLQDFPCTE